ncbi:MAG: FAD-binding oxidoreductase [Solirubrobacterales bacterium]|nr:FAD-binding oxidoreductase [Solirubrobacterales bacterium]
MSSSAGTAALRRDTVFDGWGAPGSRPQLGSSTRELLTQRLGPLVPSAAAELADVDLPPAQDLPRELVEAAGGEGSVSAAAEDRVRHAAGKSYPDLIRMRSGSLEQAPDAVLAPADARSVAAILACCAAEGIAVVPFGGGTSVVGGVEPGRGSFARLISLDLAAMREVAVDPVSQTARLGPGLRGPEAEAALNAQGFTLGHFPQSYRYATIGGYAATRSAGQSSSGYGRFDSLVTGIELTAPTGALRTMRTPHTAAGPSMRELIVGSEGILGVITHVDVAVRPAPACKHYEAWFAPGFAEGIEVVRSLAQHGELPDVVRLSDREETEVSLALAGLAGMRRAGLDRYLKLRRRETGCMFIVGWEGERLAVDRRRESSRRLLRSGGAIPLGTGAGRSWERGRYEGPHLRDSLIDAGVLVDTLETAHSYGKLGDLYDAVRGSLAETTSRGGAGGVVMCHVSHVYRDGASLYFTFLTAARPGEQLAQWRDIKAAACEAIVAAGGTITHHHAVGRDHALYLPTEIGDVGIDVLAAVKAQLDPVGVMNPGKLLPAAP